MKHVLVNQRPTDARKSNQRQYINLQHTNFYLTHTNSILNSISISKNNTKGTS